MKATERKGKRDLKRNRREWNEREEKEKGRKEIVVSLNVNNIIGPQGSFVSFQNKFSIVFS